MQVKNWLFSCSPMLAALHDVRQADHRRGHGPHATRKQGAHRGLPPPSQFSATAIAAAIFIISALLAVSPAHAQSVSAGETLWNNNSIRSSNHNSCNDCHGNGNNLPTGARANAANAKSVLNRAISLASGMNIFADGGIADLTEGEKDSLVLYLESVFDTSPLTKSTAFNTNTKINVANHVVLGTGVSSLDQLETGSNPPSKGTVSYNNSTLEITYNPSNGQVGADTFTYLARDTATNLTTSERQITVTINPPPAPNITSSNNVAAKVGVLFSYTIVATNSPTSYGASNLPPGLQISGNIIFGIPTAAGTFTATMTATNAGDTDSESLNILIAVGDPNLVLPSQEPNVQPYYPGTTFQVNPVATTDSPVTRTYSVTSTPINICSISGTTITKAGIGICYITAHQNANANWAADTSATKAVTIEKADQVITFPLQNPSSRQFVDNSTFPVTPLATGGASGNSITYDVPTTTSVCSVSGSTVTMLDSGTCTIRANQAGSSTFYAATPVSRDVVITAGEPGAPTIGAGYAGDARATITFTPPANSGAAISSYTATCTAPNLFGGGTLTSTASATTSPIVVTGMSNSTLRGNYNCTVTASNRVGTSVPSAPVTVDPSTAAVAPAFRSASTVTFTYDTNSTFTVVTTGTPDATLTRTGTLPAGVTFVESATVKGTGTLSGRPTAVPATYVQTFTATNASGTRTQSFSLVIAKRAQTISFADPVDRVFSVTPFAVTASATSGVAVTFSPSTPAVCTVTSGGTVTMLTVGDCTITANAAGNSYYLPATPLARTFVISKISQTITFGAQVSPISFVQSGTVALNPVAAASSGLPVTYNSTTPPVCSITGTIVSLLGTGTCTVEAAQAGDPVTSAANPVTQNITVSPAVQTITFNAQASQPFMPGSTFAINPLATGGASGNPVIYSTMSPACSVSGASVTQIAVGTCSINANQAGNNNYATAATVTRSVAIVATVPAAPVLNSINATDGRIRLDFTPPEFDGGSAVTGFTGNCGGVTATSNSPPIIVTGLNNGMSYSCTVTAANAAGSSPASNSLQATPSLRTGTVLWNSSCAGCHGSPPSGIRFNAAGTTGTVINAVRAEQATMLADAGVQALTLNELAEIAKYIDSFLPSINATTAYVTPVSIDVGLPNHITLGGVTFSSVEAVVPPANGTLSVFNGTVVTYTPNPGFSGLDSFTYRGKRTSPSLLLGDAHTVSITVQTPMAPVISSGLAANGVFGQSFTYQILASNSPGTFGASGLPAGLSINTNTGVISGTASAGGIFNVSISATNPGGTGSATLVITVAPAGQTISFGTQAGTTFAPGGTISINPLASASSGLAVTYSTLSPGICSVSGSTVSLLSAGSCQIAANQGGNANFNAALQVTQGIAIGASAPGAPLIGAAAAGNNQASISFTPPSNNGGSPIVQYSATCSPGGVGSNNAAPITITGLTNGQVYTCAVTATNAAALTGPPSGTVVVTPTGALVAPSINSANSTTFTVGSAGSFTVLASGNLAPTFNPVVGTLPAGITFTQATGVLSGTPASGTAAPYALTFSATNASGTATQPFTLTVAKASQSISFTNPGSRSFSLTPFALVGSASSGLTVSYASLTPGVCSVSLGNVSMLATGVCTISADQSGNADVNAATQVTQGFSINAASQSITFGAQTSPRNFSVSSFAISPLASASSGLAIIYSSLTPSVCTVSGSNVTPLTAGTCTLAANQPGNANFAAAAQVTKSVTINAVAPGAPLIGIATGADTQVNINFTPPASSGGSAITQYSVSCSPAGAASGASSPVAVTGLTNGTPYTCSVMATNAAGLTGAASGPVTATPTSANGLALWGSVCFVCHGPVPSGNQLNGAGNTAAVLAHVRTLQPLMAIFPSVQNLSNAELAALASYIGNVVPVNNVTTAYQSAVLVDVGNHITFTNQVWSAFDSVEIVTPPSNGNVGVFVGTTANYTPNAGFSGTDSFTYRGKRSAPNLAGDPRTVTITVQGPSPSISSAGTLSATFGQAVNFQVTATNSPISFAATNLPAPLVIDQATGVISGLPAAAGSFNANVSATNAGGTGVAVLVIEIAKASQAISFGAQTSPRLYSVGLSFAISPLATGGSSGASITYSSTTPAVCLVNGATISVVSAGQCTIAANQSGDNNYLPASQVTQGVTITPSAPAAPTIGLVAAGNMQAQVNFTAPSNTGGSAISTFTATCGGVSATGAGSPIVVTGLTNGASVSCTVTATGPGGTSVPSAGALVTPNAVVPPGPPIIGAFTAGDGQASISFAAPTSDGGSVITSYTAACNPGGFVGVDTTSPILVVGLTNGVTYTCSVTATNSAGTGQASSTVQVTPGAAIAFSGDVVSRKVHAGFGAFPLIIDSSVPISGAITVEPRVVGAGHVIVFSFTAPVTNLGSATVVDALGAPAGTASTVAAGSTVEVTLAGVSDNRRVTVSLAGVNAIATASASIGFLVGDVTGSGRVTGADISAIKSRITQPITTGNNFLFDIDLNGSISTADVNAAKARAGLVLP